MTFKALYRFEIKPSWEKAIAEGKKTVDVRMNIQPYADVKTGDTIRYSSSAVVVKRIGAYYGLNDLLRAEGYENVVPEAAGLNDALEALMEDLHLHDVERPHGFLAIEVEPFEEE